GIAPGSPGAVVGARQRALLFPVDEPGACARVHRLRSRDAVDCLDADGPPGAPGRRGHTMNRRRRDVRRTLHLWLPGYGAAKLRALAASHVAVKRVWVTLADHFEPWWRGADDRTALERVQRWVDRWPAIASRHVDAAGRPPCYTFFYPEEQYH